MILSASRTFSDKCVRLMRRNAERFRQAFRILFVVSTSQLCSIVACVCAGCGCCRVMIVRAAGTMGGGALRLMY